ncbi:mediator of RNA polymerase II transcription subunit 20 isoform X1 [Phacochoerus africanus]|uniref:mediator of RNA polymerase II transcription subunit 20 isoform X1 n=1 Tax=Phacochoerus africanus TaxID=41426 RepID=UPI001FD9387F|nr:mediator of RNA polymerase II transcription subunit 20 isoform X1 [Phacochoerus africanus]
MGVTCVSQMPVAEGKSVQQTVELLTRKLEMLGAEKQGTFCVDCETYHTAASTLGSQGQAGKLMYVMHNSEHPLSCFALFENGPCLIADTNFDVLMVKLKGFFQSAKASKIETRGTRYQYCDFLVKVGTVTMGPSARGISVEVEYGPCVVASDCWSLLLEFLQSFLGSHTPGAPAVFGNRHDAVYSPADTMVQYMELFNKIRKQQQLWLAEGSIQLYNWRTCHPVFCSHLFLTLFPCLIFTFLNGGMTTTTTTKKTKDKKNWDKWRYVLGIIFTQ